MSFTDANECSAVANLCGHFGSCVNIEDGGFYSCDCDDGYAGVGPASTLDLRCIGMLYNYYITQKAHIKMAIV